MLYCHQANCWGEESLYSPQLVILSMSFVSSEVKSLAKPFS